MQNDSGGGRPVDPGVEARASELTQGMLRLASKVDLAERFLASAAHEMKTPLANVRGELQLALMRERDASEYRLAIVQALDHTEQLIELTNDLLMFARISYTPAPSDPEECNLRAVILDALHLAIRRKGERRVEIAVDDELNLYGRPEELTRLFRNLLDNALEYSPPEGPILVRAVRDGEKIAVAIEDNGKALDPALAETLFMPFRRGTSGGGGGFGLGLGIARAIARGHGGDLTLDLGAEHVRFVLRLPQNWRPEPQLTPDSRST
jgi:two-component system, OmpR family, sensor kinase